MKKRMKKKLAGFLALILVLQCFGTTSLFADEIDPAAEAKEASVSTEAPAADSETAANPQEGSGTEAAGTGETGSETPAASEDTAKPEAEDSTEPAAGNSEVSENTASSDEVPAGAASENAVSENSASGNSISANAEEEENAGDAAPKKAVTVMLYQIGCDLERGSLAARSDLLEIMKGIHKRESKDYLAPSVNFVVETGGMDGTKDMDAYRKLMAKGYADLEEKAGAGGHTDDDELDFDNFKTISSNIDYTENQRWVLSGNSISEAKTQPSKPSRPMNEALGDGLNEELKEFINTTITDYEADQYILIFWDHGGGSTGGCGNDERLEGSIQSSNIRATMPETLLAKDDRKLAWVGYDACLMANVETALTWARYARCFTGSEELEGNDGWAYTEWVKQLCDEAAENGSKFKSDSDTYDIIAGDDGVAWTEVAEFVKHYEGEGNATHSLVDLRSFEQKVGYRLQEYAYALLDVFEAYPIDTYRSIRLARDGTQSFMGTNPPYADINDLTSNLEDDYNGIAAELEAFDRPEAEVKKHRKALEEKGKALRDAIDTAVVSENHTDDYQNLGGLTVYFPYASMMKDKYSNKDNLQNYREMYDEEAVLDPYIDLLGLYYSVRSAGDRLDDNEKTKGDIEDTFNEALNDYKVKDYQEKGSVASVPSELIEHRIQNEAIKIRKDDSGGGNEFSLVRRDFTLFDSFDQHLVIERKGEDEESDEDDVTLYLGYLHGGEFKEDTDLGVWKQDLYNYNDPKKWFGIVSANGAKYPTALYSVITDGSDALKNRTDVIIPVLDENDAIYLLDVSFAEGNDKGEFKGMWPYAYDYNQLGRFIYNDGKEGTEKIRKSESYRLLGNVLESIENRSDIDFNPNKPGDYAYAVIGVDTLLNSTSGKGFQRNIPLADFGKAGEPWEPYGDYDEAYISDELRDIFDSAYFYGENPSYKEELAVSIELNKDVSAVKKGTDLVKQDLRVVLKNPAGDEVFYTEPNMGEATLFCLKDENGKEVPITVKTVDKQDYLMAEGNRLTANDDLTIYLKEKKSVSFDSYLEIDYATETREQSFELKNAEGGESVTVPVYDPESDKLSVAVLSTPLYYLDNYMSEGLKRDNYADYFKVTIGDIDVTNDAEFKKNLRFGYKTENGSSWTWKESLSKTLTPGTEVAIDIKYDTLSANNIDDPLILQKSPAKIRGTEPVRSARLEKLIDEYSGPIEVKYYDAKGKEITGYDSKFVYTEISGISKEKSAKITTRGMDNTISFNYIDLPLSLKGELKTDFGDYFEITEFVLSSYVVYNVSNVRFLSSTNRKALAAPIKVLPDSETEDGRVSVSKGSIPITGETPIEWYYKAGTAYPTVVFRDDAPVAYGKADLVEKNKKGEWLFYIPDNLDGEDVIFYAGYAPEAKNEGDIEVKIDPITPVEYTGRNIVTTKSTKSGSKLLGLVVRSLDGEVELVENVDYTVSYKNNKNVSDIYDRKPPTVIIKGKNAYKGLKYTVNFSILPADFANAYISVDRRYAPLNSNKKKGVTLVATVKLPGGAKVPSNRVELHFYTKDDKGLRTEVTRSELASYYKMDKVYPLYVSAKAIQPADQGSNFVTGSVIDPVREAFVYAYPKTTGKIAVTLRTKKYEYTENGQKIDDIFKSSNIKNLKAGGKTVSIGQIEPVEAYYDKKLTEPVLSDVLKDAGTYYLNVALKDDAKAQYRVFNSTPVQVTITGTKLKRSNIALMNTKIVAVSSNAREPESVPLLLRFASDFNWKTLLVRCTQRDGGTVDFYINEDDANCYEEYGMRYYELLGVDNGAIGSYKLTVYGAEGYTGNVTYSYKVVAK